MTVLFPKKVFVISALSVASCHSFCPQAADVTIALNKQTTDFESLNKYWRIIDIKDPIPNAKPYKSVNAVFVEQENVCLFGLWPFGHQKEAQPGEVTVKFVQNAQ